jgi:hypothetical protein
MLEFDEKKVVGTVVMKKDLTEKDVENIMVTAIEGGIGYWAKLHNDKPEWSEKPSDEPASTWAAKLLIDGKEVIFSETETEEDDEHELVLTLEKLIKGVELNATHRKWDADIDNGDATTADCIVQYAIFNEVVYG